MDKRPSHFSIPGRVLYPRFPGFSLSADKFLHLLRPVRGETAMTGRLWYGEDGDNVNDCIYSPSGTFAPKIGGISPASDEINGAIHWGNSIFRTTDGTWALVVDSGAPAFNPFEEWHLEPDPEGEEGDTIRVYHGWGWWELTIPSTFSFSSTPGANRLTLTPRGTLLNDSHAQDRDNPPELDLEWDAYYRYEKPDAEDGPGGSYRDKDGNRIVVGNPTWTSDNEALSRLVAIRTTTGWRYMANGSEISTRPGGLPLLNHGDNFYLAHEAPVAEENIRFQPCTADGQVIDPSQTSHQPFTASWDGYMTAVRPKADVWACDLPTVLNDLGED